MMYSKENQPTKTASATSKKYASSVKRMRMTIGRQKLEVSYVIFHQIPVFVGRLAGWRI